MFIKSKREEKKGVIYLGLYSVNVLNRNLRF